jgi:hypothetical protein
LVVVGSQELINWRDVVHLDDFAESLRESDCQGVLERSGLAGLASVASILENVTSVLDANQNAPTNQLE